MALVAGQAPFYEKYGMTIHNRMYPYGDDASYSLDGIFKLKFNFPTPDGTTTDIIQIQNYWLNICVPVHMGELDSYWGHSYYYFCLWDIDSAKYIYTDNQTNGFRLRYETERGAKYEVILLPNGNIQFKNSQRTYMRIRKYGFGEVAYLDDPYEGAYNNAGTYVFSKEGTGYTLYSNYYDDTVPFSAPTKIIDTVYLKTSSGIKPYNVYGLNANIDATSYQKFRVKTPNGVGYVYSEPVSSLAAGELGFCIGTQKYVIRQNSKSVTPSTSYEYTRLDVGEKTSTVSLGTQYVGYSRGYWNECWQMALSETYDTPVYNLLLYGCVDVYPDSTMSTPSSAEVYAAVNGTSWFSTGNISRGGGYCWYHSLNSNPNSTYTTYSSLQNFSLEPYSYYGRYGYYKYNQIIVSAYAMIATTTVI